MIERLAGALLEIGEGHVLLDVHGIGFRLEVSAATAARLPAVGEGASLVVRMLLHREEAVHLYGFAQEEEAAFFDRLRAVSGVGPSVALSLLALTLPRLRQAIRDKDVKVLQAAPGVGAKLARRLITELAEALPEEDSVPAAAPELRDPVREQLVTAFGKSAVHRSPSDRGGCAVGSERDAGRRTPGPLQGRPQSPFRPRLRVNAPSPADANEFWQRAHERVKEASGLLARVRRISTARLAVAVIALALTLGAGEGRALVLLVGRGPLRILHLAGARPRAILAAGARSAPCGPVLPPGRPPGGSRHRGRARPCGHAGGRDPARRNPGGSDFGGRRPPTGQPSAPRVGTWGQSSRRAPGPLRLRRTLRTDRGLAYRRWWSDAGRLDAATGAAYRGRGPPRRHPRACIPRRNPGDDRGVRLPPTLAGRPILVGARLAGTGRRGRPGGRAAACRPRRGGARTVRQENGNAPGGDRRFPERRHDVRPHPVDLRRRGVFLPGRALGVRRFRSVASCSGAGAGSGAGASRVRDCRDPSDLPGA